MSSPAEERSRWSGATNAQTVLLGDSQHRWLLGIDPQQGLNHFGLDSEGTGREKSNLLAAPIGVSWTGGGGPATNWQQAEPGTWTCVVSGAKTGSSVTWSVTRSGDDLVWSFLYQGDKPASDLSVSLPFNALMGAAVLIPAKLDSQSRAVGPWLLVVPDFGHLRVEAEPLAGWHVVNSGKRGGGPNAPSTGVDPHLRGQAWLDAVKIPDYRPGRLTLQFVCIAAGRPRHTPHLEVSTAGTVNTPKGIDSTDLETNPPPVSQQLAAMRYVGRSASDVGAGEQCFVRPGVDHRCLFYAEPMLFWREPVAGIDVQLLLRHSLDYWLHNQVSAQGHVNAFGTMYDLYPSCGRVRDRRRLGLLDDFAATRNGCVVRSRCCIGWPTICNGATWTTTG